MLLQTDRYCYEFRVFALALAVIVGNIIPASARQMTVGDLQAICTAPDQGNKHACTFYMLGVLEGSSLAAGTAGDKDHFCVPEGVSATVLEFTVKKKIGEDLMFFPKDRDMPAVSFVGGVIQTTFPCHPK
jgi:hypothetical protein